MRVLTAALLVASVIGAGAVLAEPRLEIIPLRHRPAEQLMPSLRPLVESGGAISNAGDKILLRVSAQNLAELREAIVALDTPIRRLLVSVRQDGGQQSEQGRVGVGAVIAPSDTRLRIDGGVTASQRDAQVDQQVQVMEGSRAWIQIGRSVPLALREWRPVPGGWAAVDSVRYQDVGSGFYAMPQVVGERVTIEISPASSRLDGAGVVEGARLSTTVSGPLGIWIPLGGSQLAESNTGYATGGYTQGSVRQDAQVWLRVDTLE